MRRIVFIESDAGYYHFLQASVKSFVQYNPGWEVWVGNYGLTDEQLHEIKQTATVIDLPRYPSARWPIFYGRMKLFAMAGEYPDAIFLQLDADTLTFGPFDPAVRTLQLSGSDVASKYSQWPAHRGIRDCQRKVYELFPGFDNWRDKSILHMGSILGTGKAFGRIGELALPLLKNHIGLFSLPEQVCVTALVYEHNFKLLRLPERYNTPLIAPHHIAGLAPGMPPIESDGQPIVLAHIPIHKEQFQNSECMYYNLNQWWLSWEAHYARKPWPNLTPGSQ